MHLVIVYLCLLIYLLPSTINTINHNILLIRLSSWFRIHSNTLTWFRSYLSSRCFHMKCKNNFSFYVLASAVFPKALFLALYTL